MMFEAVSISCEKREIPAITQSGLKIGNYVITIGNYIRFASFALSDVKITFKFHDELISLSPNCCKFIDSRRLKNSFYYMFFGRNDICSEYYERLFPNEENSLGFSFSTFIIFGFGPCSSNYVYIPIPPNNFTKKIDIGDDIIVTYTPMGLKTFFNSMFNGAISGFCEDPSVFLTDAKLSLGSSGAPIYRKNEPNVPLGITVTSIFQRKGPFNPNLIPWGISICVQMSLIYDELWLVKLPPSNLHEMLESLSKPKICNFPANSIYPITKACSYMNHQMSYHENPAFLGGQHGKGLEFLALIDYSGSQGTGIVLSEDGLIITCGHTVKFASGGDIFVTINGDRFPGKVIYSGKNKSMDVAIISLLHPKRLKLTSCVLSKESPKSGEVVYAAGYSCFLNEKIKLITKGVVVLSNDCMLNTSNTIHPGCSGGAILRQSGEFIGLISCTVNYYDDVHMFTQSIPISTIYKNLVSFVEKRDLQFLKEMEDKYTFLDISKY